MKILLSPKRRPQVFAKITKPIDLRKHLGFQKCSRSLWGSFMTRPRIIGVISFRLIADVGRSLWTSYIRIALEHRQIPIFHGASEI